MKGKVVAFRVKNENAEMWELFKIALKENGSNVSHFIAEHMINYMKTHGNGGQARLVEYSDHEQNRAEIHREIKAFYLSQSEKGREVKDNDVKITCRARIPNVKAALEMAKRITTELKEDGVTITWSN